MMAGAHDDRPRMERPDDLPERPQREFVRVYDDEHPEGHVRFDIFAGIMGTATVFLIAAGLTFFSVGMVFGATLGGGIGGFIADFDEVVYEDGDAEIYPVVDAHPACDDAPQLEISLGGTTTLQGDVRFFKDLPLPDAFDSEQIARISIVAEAPPEGIEADDLDIRLTALSADDANFATSVLREFGPDSYADDPDNVEDTDKFAESGEGTLDPDETNASRVPEYGISSNEFTLAEGGTAAAHQVSLDSIELQTVNLFIAINDRSEFDNPVERVIDPGERECSSLVDET